MAARPLLALLLLTCLVAAPVAAQEQEPPRKPETRKVLPIRKSAFTRLDKAHKALEAEDFGRAIREMEALGQRELNGHERALMHQTLGYAYSGREEFRKAAEAFAAALATGQLSPAARTSTRYNLGQLHVMNGEHARAIEALEAWFAEAENPQPAAHFLLAQAYVQDGQTDAALRWARRGLERSDRPRESWLQLVLALEFERKDYRAVAELLERLVARFPRKRYWLQLYAAYSELGEQQRAYAAFELAAQQGLLSEDRELRQLAQLHLHHEAPYKAARLLERELAAGRIRADREAWELLANAWIAAREYRRAIEPLGKAAAAAEDGRLFVRLGQAHMENEDWEPAVRALRAALERGGLDEPGRVRLLLGICHVNAGRLDAAERVFRQARSHEGVREDADTWLRHVELERGRRATARALEAREP